DGIRDFHVTGVQTCALPISLLLVGIFAVIAFWLRGTFAGLLTFAGFAFIVSLDLWENAMITLSLVLVATLIALIISVPVGIWARSEERRVGKGCGWGGRRAR